MVCSCVCVCVCPQDDQVLVAFVTEFGQNWYLVADVLRTANSIAGVSRRWDACRARYVQLLRSSLQVCEGLSLSLTHTHTHTLLLTLEYLWVALVSNKHKSARHMCLLASTS